MAGGGVDRLENLVCPLTGSDCAESCWSKAVTGANGPKMECAALARQRTLITSKPETCTNCPTSNRCAECIISTKPDAKPEPSS